MLPIPGTGKVRHLEENTAAAGIRLGEEDFRALDAQGREEWRKVSGGRRGPAPVEEALEVLSGLGAHAGLGARRVRPESGHAASGELARAKALTIFGGIDEAADDTAVVTG